MESRRFYLFYLNPKKFRWNIYWHAQLHSIVNFIAGINSIELWPFIMNKSFCFSSGCHRHCESLLQRWRTQTTRHSEVDAPNIKNKSRFVVRAKIKKQWSKRMFLPCDSYYHNIPIIFALKKSCSFFRSIIYT